MSRVAVKSAVIVFVILFLSSLGAAKDLWVTVEKEFVGAHLLEVEKHDLSGATIGVDVGRLLLKDVAYKGEEFVWLDIEGAGQTSEIGRPRLPVIRKLVQVPFNADVSVAVAGGREFTFELARKGFALSIFPVQPPIPKTPGARGAAELVIDEDFYARDELWPHELVRIAHEGVIRGRRVVLLEIYPVRYNPVLGVVSVATGFKVELSTKPLGGRTPIWMEQERLNAQSFDRYLKGFLLAPEQKGYFDIPSTYLVIAAPAYVGDADLLAYVALKRKRGFDVVVVSTDETGTTASQIRSYIKEALNTWDHPPAFVLLVGDTDTIPSWTGCGAGLPDTDLYYAALDGEKDYCDDYFADLFIGRFSVRSSSELHNIVNKSSSFEWLSEVGYDWIKTATFLASVDNHDVSEGTHNYVIDTHLTPAGYTSYKRYYNDGATTAEVLADINGGLSLVTYSGHGGTTEWADGPPVDQDDVRSLTNTYYPLVQSYACLTGSYDSLDECFGETWIRDDHAAVAFWGSSVTSYWDEDDILERRLFDGFFAGDKSVYYTWIGGMTDYGKIKLYEHYGDTPTIQRYFEMYNIMGDAAIDVWTDEPITLDPTYSPLIELGATSYTVTFSEPQAESAVASLLKDDGLVGAARVSGGVATINFDEPISEAGTYLLSVVGHNIAPFEASVEAMAVSSDGVVSMDRDVYGGNDTINIYLTDADLLGDGTHDVDVKSDSHTTPIAVTLTEQGTSGVFKGSIGTTPAAEQAEDALPVSDGDTITATYIDADDGEGGHNVPKTDTATADLAAPDFDGLQSADGGDGQVSLVWQPGTDISLPVTYLVFRSTESGDYDFNSPMVETMDTSYIDTDVINYVTYYYVVRARDSLDNTDSNTVERSAQPAGPVCFYDEGFETRSVSDWTVVDNDSDGVTWTTDNSQGRTSQWWDGVFFIADSGMTGGGMDEDLISPVINASFFTGIELNFGYDHVKNTLASKGEAYIRCGEDDWSREFKTKETDGGIASVEFPSSMDRCGAVQVKFSYSQWGTMADSWFGVDNIEVCGEPIGDPFPEAEFAADVTEGRAPLDVSFTDMSQGAVLSYFWDFGDGETSTEENPVHTYLEPGTYTVSLTVEGVLGDDTMVKDDYIAVSSEGDDDTDDDTDDDSDGGRDEGSDSSGCGCSI